MFEVTIPEDRVDAIERYQYEPAFHEVVEMTARASDFSREQIISGRGPRVLKVQEMALGVAPSG